MTKNFKKIQKTIDFTLQRCYYHIQLFEREKQIKKYILYVQNKKIKKFQKGVDNQKNI